LHPATGLQNNLICESHPLLDRAADSIHNGGSVRGTVVITDHAA